MTEVEFDQSMIRIPWPDIIQLEALISHYWSMFVDEHTSLYSSPQPGQLLLLTKTEKKIVLFVILSQTSIDGCRNV